MKKPLTLFIWECWSWGNHRRQLVRAVDGVEEARGFKPLVLINILIRREVGAKGFMGDACRPSRHRHLFQTIKPQSA